MYQAPRPRRLALLGPAYVAAVAYVDPGNVATNVTAGARYGFTLAWVVVFANVMAMLVQYLSAKLGIVTGQSLAAQLGRRMSPLPRRAFWLQAEIIAIATDLAEIVGGAIALQLLFRIPLVLGAILTAATSLVILWIGDVRGQRVFERVIMGFLGLIAAGFVAGVFLAPPDPGQLASELLPGFADADSVILASGIVGATVMPHVIYLHSSLTTYRAGTCRTHLETRDLLAGTRTDVVTALVMAGGVNLALLLLAATSLAGIPGTDTLHGVHAAITSELGTGIALLFGVALLSSGFASTSVGNAAGAEVMQGLLRRRIPTIQRRCVTLTPALIVLALGVEPSTALILSQVVLSLGIPFALIPLVRLTGRHDLMGRHVNSRTTKIAAWTVSALVIGLNLSLLTVPLLG